VLHNIHIDLSEVQGMYFPVSRGAAEMATKTLEDGWAESGGGSSSSVCAGKARSWKSPAHVKLTQSMLV